MNKRISAISIILLVFATAGFAQTDRQHVRQGNRHYQAGKFDEAELSYRQSLQQNPQNLKGMFNLGNSLYRQGRFDEAAELFQGLSQVAPDDNQKAFAFHNLGNSFLQSQKYAESVEAYKNSLRLNPDDEQTRFNLAWAMRLLQEQQQQQQNQGNQNQDDQNKDQQQNQQPPQGEDEQQKQQQPRPNQISPQDAERILDALNQKEQNVQQELKRDQGQRQPARHAREW